MEEKGSFSIGQEENPDKDLLDRQTPGTFAGEIEADESGSFALGNETVPELDEINRENPGTFSDGE